MKVFIFLKTLIILHPIIFINYISAYPWMLDRSSKFNINSTKPGNIQHQGEGTAQFNNSIGTNNNFQVGSSTNLGVNASASSTPEYGINSQARLDLASTTTLTQVIGTSGASQSTTDTAKAAYAVAHEAASTRAHSRGLEVQRTWEASNGGSYANSSGYSSEGAWNADRKAAYDVEYNNTYDSEYSREFSRTLTNVTSSNSSSGNSGTIKGVFKTEETGAAVSNGTSVDWTASALSEAESEYGTSYSDWQANGSTNGYKGTSSTITSAGDWQQAYNAAYSRSYATSAAGAARSSDSSVEVNGIGSDANVAAASTSTFDVKISATSGTSFDFGSTATANGTAGSSLATSSFATQSNAATSSGFMQAFGNNNKAHIIHILVNELMQSWEGGYEWRDDPEFNGGYQNEDEWRNAYNNEFARAYFSVNANL